MSPQVERDPLGIVGTVVDGKYRVDAFVAEGGLSFVYRAMHEVWDRPIALKCFKPGAIPQESREALLESFLQEGRLMAELSSRNSGIVQARDVGTLDLGAGRWVPFLVLEWLQGEPLDLMLRREREMGLPPRSLSEVIALLDGPARALTYAHERGVAHRDLKPENLMVVRDEEGRVLVKILDFGVAKVMKEPTVGGGGDERHETLAQVMAFTPHYAAPEQFTRTYGATGPWTDVHAFALLVLEVMRGWGPVLEGTTPFQLAVSCCDPHRRPTPRALGMTVSDAVEQVFARALAIAPGERQAGMGEFWSALTSAAEAPVQATTNAPPAGDPAGPRQVRRRWKRMPIGASLVLVLSAAAFWPETSEPSASAAPSLVASAALPSGSSHEVLSPPRCPEGMVLLPGGSFLMGIEDPAWEGWRPAHPQKLQPFCIDTHEVTVRDYRGCVDANECRPAYRNTHWFRTGMMSPEQSKLQATVYGGLCNAARDDKIDHPVNCVDWFQASDYCAWRGSRLPTEAEWEFAARGIEGRTYPWGEEPPDERRANGCGRECTRWQKSKGVVASSQLFTGDDGYVGTSPVGSFPAGASPEGVYDLIGNVFEWTDDWFAPYTLMVRTEESRRGEGDRKVIRGGSFSGYAPVLAAATFRHGMAPGFHVHGVGFRCAKSP